MSIPGVIFDHSTGNFAGAADTVDMPLDGIKSGDNLLAVITWTAAGVVVGQDKTDFTVADGKITAGTIDLSSQTGVAIWTNAPAA